MKKAQKRFFGTALTLSTVASVVAPVAVSAATQTYEEAKAKVDAAKATPVFSLFNTAYEAVIGLKDEAKKAELLNELAPLWDKVNTPYVQEILGQLESLAKDKNLKTYHEVLAKIEANTTEAVNKEYLKGELVAWAASGSLYTTAEKAAIDAIVKAWTDKTPASIAAAKEATAKVTNAGSIEWLNAQIAEVQGTMTASITEVKVVGAKKIEVKFNKPVDDTKAVIAVKKGSVTPAISTKTYSTDKTSVVIELSGKISVGEYTVEVTGVADAAISGKVTAVDEKVSKIEFLSETANIVTTNATSGAIEKLQAAYKVLNQYGEDVTKATSLTATAGVAVGTSGSVSASNGKLVVEGILPGGAPRLGEKIAVSLVHTDSATTVSAILTVSNKISVSSVAVSKIYNENKEELTSDSTPSDFALVMDVKDQYGNAIVDETILEEDLIVSVANTTVTNVNYIDAANNKANFEKIKIDGEDKIVLKLAPIPNAASLDYDIKAGKSLVTFISKTSAQSGNYEVQVSEGVKVDTIVLNQPETIVAAGETIEIPFTAEDTYGRSVVKASTLNNNGTAGDLRGVRITASGAGIGNQAVSFKQDYATGKAYLEVDVTAEGVLNITAITATNKVVSLNVSVKKVAVPTAIIGFDSDAPTNALLNEKFTLEPKNFIVQDQYGRTMSDTKFKNSLGTTDGKSRVIITGATANNSFTLSGAGSTLNSGTAKTTFTAGGTKGTERIEFKIEKNDNGTWKNVSGSEYEVSARAVELKELKSYEVGTVAKIFDEQGYAAEKGITVTDISKYTSDFKVYGKLSDGSKVLIPSGPAAANVLLGTSEYYTVTTNDATVLTPSDNTDMDKTLLNVTGAAVYAKDTDSKTYQVKVTINHTGDVITNDIIVSKAKPEVVGVEFNDDLTDTDGKVTDGIDIGSVYLYDVSNGTTVSAIGASGLFAVQESATPAEKLVLVKDQYGKTTYISPDGVVAFDDVVGASQISTRVTSVTFSDLVEDDNDKSLKTVNNGQLGAQVVGVEAGDTFTVTFTFANGKTASLKVAVTD